MPNGWRLKSVKRKLKVVKVTEVKEPVKTKAPVQNKLTNAEVKRISRDLARGMNYPRKFVKTSPQGQYMIYRQKMLSDKTLYPSLVEFDKLKGAEVTKFFKQWNLPSNPIVASYYLRMCPLHKIYYDKQYKDALWYNLARETFTTKYAERQNEESEKLKAFRERHYWRPLTDAQKLYVIEQNKIHARDGKPYKFSGKPLSPMNVLAVDTFAKQYFKNPDKFNISKTDLEKTAEEETIAVGKAITSMMSPKFVEVMGLKRLTENVPATTEVKIKDNRTVDVELKFASNKEQMSKRFQALKDSAYQFPIQMGLNSFAKRKGLKYPIDVPQAYLDELKKGNPTYVVNSFQNAVALASSIGMLPQELFIITCQQIVKRKKHYRDQMMIMLGTAVEELVELFNNKAEKSFKFFDLKLSVRKFFKSQERKDWSKKYSYDWKNHVRFNEDFKEWRTIVSAKAVKKEQ